MCVRTSESAAEGLGVATAALPDSPGVPAGHRPWLPCLCLPGQAAKTHLPTREEEQQSSLGDHLPSGSS